MPQPSKFYEHVGKQIRQARGDRRMTQEDLAGRVALTRTSITNIERGRQKLLVHTLAKIAEVLRVPIATLVPELKVDADASLDRALKKKPEQERDFIRNVLRSAIPQRSEQ